MRKHDMWNRCSKCGRFIPVDAFEDNTAIRRMITPDSEFTMETWENLCRPCTKFERFLVKHGEKKNAEA